MTYDVSLPGPVRLGLLSGGSKTRVVDTLPPTGTPGQTIIVQNGPNFSYYLWNSVSNRWVEIVDNQYVTKYNGDDYDSDASGPLTFNDFSDQNFWTRYELYPYLYISYAGGLPTFRADGPAVLQVFPFYTGIMFRKAILPARTGLIDVEYQMVNVGTDALISANHSFDLGVHYNSRFISTYVGTQSDTGFVGMTRRSAYSPNGRYFFNGLHLEAAADESIGALLNPGSSIDSYICRFQVAVRQVGINPWAWYIERNAITFAHNGGLPVVLGGVATGATYANTAPVHKGLVLGVGCRTPLQRFDAKTFGTLTWLTIHSGRLVSW